MNYEILYRKSVHIIFVAEVISYRLIDIAYIIYGLSYTVDDVSYGYFNQCSKSQLNRIYYWIVFFTNIELSTLSYYNFIWAYKIVKYVSLDKVPYICIRVNSTETFDTISYCM